MTKNFQQTVTYKGVDYEVVGSVTYTQSQSRDYDQPDDPVDIDVDGIYFMDEKLNVVNIFDVLDSLNVLDRILERLNLEL